MKDYRVPLAPGTKLRFSGTEYTIAGLMGRGSNALCYKASYEDAHIRHKTHAVLIKELFPLHGQGMVERGENGAVSASGDEAEAFLALHRRSFLRASEIGIDLNEYRPDKSMPMLNTCEIDGTLYCVIGLSGGEPLSEKPVASLKAAAQCAIDILHALRPFHEKNLLHLDISPDNILLMPRDKGEAGQRALLIDYNSVFSADEISSFSGMYFSIKKPFTAPEVILNDLASIGFGTDLYSVAAVFGALIHPNFDGNPAQITPALDIFRNVPQTAVHKTIQIMRKGLRLSAKRRYTAIDELLYDLRELLNRIDHAGITRPALWEASASAFKAEIANNALFAHLNDSAIPSPLTLKDITAHTMLTGSGGMGKTTALLRIWRDSAAVYSPLNPAVIYIRLSGYDKPGTIGLRCLDRLRFTEKTATVADALHALDAVLDEGTPDAPSMVFLLDGYNEAPPDMRPALNAEILELQKHSGAVIVLASRTDENLPGFRTVTLAPLDDHCVGRYLEQSQLLYPEDSAMRALLANPMMLALYAKVSRGAPSHDKLYTGDTLIRAYFDYLTATSRNPNAAGFAVDYLAAKTAAAMAKRGAHAFRPEELYEITEAAFREVRRKGFPKAFPAYIGKTGDILGGTHTADAWFSYIVTDILVKELSLLTVNENGGYSFAHQLFRDALAICGASVAQTRNRAKAKRIIPRAAAAALLTAALVFGINAVIPRQQSVYPNTAEEQSAVAGALDQATIALYYFGIHADNSLDAIDCLSSAEYIDDSLRFHLETQLSSAAAMEIAPQLAENLAAQLYIPNNTIPLDTLRALYTLPAQYRDTNSKLIDGVLANWDKLPQADRDAVCRQYAEWTDINARIAVMYIRHILAELPGEYAEGVFKYGHSALITDKLLNTAYDGESYNWELTQLENAAKAALDVLRTKGVLQGG